MQIERAVEIVAPRWRPGWLAAVLGAHIGVALLVMHCAELERLDAPGMQQRQDATPVSLRQPPRVAPRHNELHPRIVCGGLGIGGDDREPAPPVASIRPSAIRMIAPRVLHSLRISGDTQIEPSAHVQLLMRRSGATTATGIVKVCIGTEGTVTSVTVQRSTKYKDYDAAIVSRIRGWRYRGYWHDGAAIPVCANVTILARL